MRPLSLALLAGAFAAGVLVPPTARAATVLTVAASGGQFTSVQAAIDAVPAGGASYVIRVGAGSYDETIDVPADKPNLTIEGATGNPEDVVIAAGNAAWMTRPGGGSYGTAGSATVQAHDVTVENITIANTYDPAAHSQGYAQAVAIDAGGDRQVYVDDRVLGLQDTVLTWEPQPTDGYRQLFAHSYLAGDVDFLCGDTTAVFYADTIQLVDRGAAAGGTNGYLAAPATDAAIAHGYLIDASTVTSTAALGTFFLGRPWHPFSGADPRIVIRDTVLPAAIKSSPWTTMHGYSFTAGRYGEYHNTGPGSGVNADRPQLTAAQAATETPRNDLAGNDGWHPLG